MSFLGNLINSLTGKTDNDFTPPNSLCPGSCAIGPGACTECLPYKEKLKDALYNVDHMEEYYARYEVVSSVSTGTTACPHCGAPSADRFVCEYCGMQITADDGKIRVTSANEIPDPIIEARDIIYERHRNIVEKDSAQDSGGILSWLFDLLDGDASDGIGERMSRDEIVEAASLYSVSVSSYLNGLDNGVYKTLSEKKREDSAVTAAGVGGMAMGAGSTYVSGGSYGYASPQMPPHRPPHRPEPRYEDRPRPQNNHNTQGHAWNAPKPQQGSAQNHSNSFSPSPKPQQGSAQNHSGVFSAAPKPQENNSHGHAQSPASSPKPQQSRPNHSGTLSKPQHGTTQKRPESSGSVSKQVTSGLKRGNDPHSGPRKK